MHVHRMVVTPGDRVFSEQIRGLDWLSDQELPQLSPSDARSREEIATTLDRAHDVVLENLLQPLNFP